MICDINDIKNFYNFFKHTKQTEIRVFDRIKYPLGKSFWINNEEEFVKLVKQLNENENVDVYIGGRDRISNNEEGIINSHFIFFEIDEHNIEKPEEINKIKQFLEKNNIEIGMQGFSGGGYHFYIPHSNINLSNLETKQYYKEVLQKFKIILKKEGINIDGAVFDLPRVSRVLGTFNYKRQRKSCINFIKNINLLKNQEAITKIIEKIPIESIENKDVIKILEKYKINLSDKWLYDLIKNKIIIPEDTGGNSIFFKNTAIICAREDMTNNEINSIAKNMSQLCVGRSSASFKGWIEKAKENKLIEVGKIEINNCIDKYQHQLTKYPQIVSYTSAFLDDGTNISVDYKKLAKIFILNNPYCYDSHKIWWCWNNNKYCWERKDEIDIMILIDKGLRWSATTNSNVKNQILEALKRVGREYMPLEPKKIWIQFKDKIIDIETNEIFKASSKYFITNPIPWELGESKETPILDRILHEWVDKEYVQTLKEIIAYCVLPCMPIHRIFCLDGSGLNGKSSYLRLIEKIVGDENTTCSDIKKITRNDFETSKLYKKLVCVMGEIDKSIFRQTATLKRLCGDDLIPIEFKGKDGFGIHNYAKPIIATNKLPQQTDKTRGFYRRWTIVDFPNEFTEKQDILKQIPDEEIKNFCSTIPNILQELLKQGEFTNDGNIEKRERRYIERSSPIYEFIKKYCEIGDNYRIRFSEFYNEFCVFIEDNDYPHISENLVGRQLNSMGLKTINHVEEINGIKTSINMKIGLKLKN